MSDVTADNQRSADTQATGDQTQAANTEQSPAASGPWFSGIKDAGTRGWVETKGYENLDAMAKSHQELEKFIGVPKDKILTLPKDDNDTEGREKIYKALGRPDAPEGYKIDIPEGVDGAYAKEAAKWFHAQGLNQKQVDAIVAGNNEFIAAIAKQTEEARIAKQAEVDAQSKKDLDKLVVDLGGQAKYEEAMEIGRRFTKAKGYDAEFLTKIEGAVGTYGFAKFITDIAASSGIAEDTLHGVGKGGPVGYTKEGAAAKRSELMSDKGFVDRYVKGDTQAKQEMDRLERIIAGVE